MFRCSLVLPHFFVSFHIFDRAFSNKTFWKFDVSNPQTSTEHKNVIVSTFHHGCCKLGCGLLIIIIHNNKFAFFVLKLVNKASHHTMTQTFTDASLIPSYKNKTLIYLICKHFLGFKVYSASKTNMWIRLCRNNVSWIVLIFWSNVQKQVWFLSGNLFSVFIGTLCLLQWNINVEILIWWRHDAEEKWLLYCKQLNLYFHKINGK